MNNFWWTKFCQAVQKACDTHSQTNSKFFFEQMNFRCNLDDFTLVLSFIMKKKRLDFLDYYHWSNQIVNIFRLFGKWPAWRFHGLTGEKRG